MQFIVKGSGHTLWKAINNKGYGVDANGTLRDKQIVESVEERPPYVHLKGLGWTKRIWLEVYDVPPVEVSPLTELRERVEKLEARVLELERRISVLDAPLK